VPVIILSLISAILFRLGGSSYDLPLKTKWRDVGCTICTLLTIWTVGIYAELVQTAIYFALSWGVLSLSCDFWGSDDIEWYERALWGFVQGLSAIPIAVYTGRYTGFFIRILILTIFMPFSDKLQLKIFLDKADSVELSRGFMYNITIPLLLV